MSTLVLKLDTPHGDICVSVPFIAESEDGINSVEFTDFGDKKIATIKEIRAYLGMNLKDLLFQLKHFLYQIHQLCQL